MVCKPLVLEIDLEDQTARIGLGVVGSISKGSTLMLGMEKKLCLLRGQFGLGWCEKRYGFYSGIHGITFSLFFNYL